jgi:hypothetical protein
MESKVTLHENPVIKLFVNSYELLKSKGFWHDAQLSDSLGLLALLIARNSKYLENATFRKPTLLGHLTKDGPALSKGLNKVGVSFPSSDEGNIQIAKRCAF